MEKTRSASESPSPTGCTDLSYLISISAMSLSLFSLLVKRDFPFTCFADVMCCFRTLFFRDTFSRHAVQNNLLKRLGISFDRDELIPGQDHCFELVQSHSQKPHYFRGLQLVLAERSLKTAIFPLSYHSYHDIVQKVKLCSVTHLQTSCSYMQSCQSNVLHKLHLYNHSMHEEHCM